MNIVLWGHTIKRKSHSLDYDTRVCARSTWNVYYSGETYVSYEGIEETPLQRSTLRISYKSIYAQPIRNFYYDTFRVVQSRERTIISGRLTHRYGGRVAGSRLIDEYENRLIDTMKNVSNLFYYYTRLANGISDGCTRVRVPNKSIGRTRRLRRILSVAIDKSYRADRRPPPNGEIFIFINSAVNANAWFEGLSAPISLARVL